MASIDHTGRRAREEISNTKETGREETKGRQGNPRKKSQGGMSTGVHMPEF